MRKGENKWIMQFCERKKRVDICCTVSKKQKEKPKILITNSEKLHNNVYCIIQYSGETGNLTFRIFF